MESITQHSVLINNIGQSVLSSRYIDGLLNQIV